MIKDIEFIEDENGIFKFIVFVICLKLVIFLLVDFDG